MKSLLGGAPVVRTKDWALTLVPFLIWMGLIELRPTLLHPYCAANPTPCTTQSLPAWDRATLGLESPTADGASYFTQNLSGAIAAAVPLGWSAGLAMTGTLAWPAAMAAAGTDLVILAQTAGINGLLTEAAHALTGRPRPFVYGDPSGRGRDPQNYTSFYSGHTSFAAAAGTCLLLTLLARGAPLWLLVLLGGTTELLVISTALFRMLAGRHFLTDVVSGAVAGTMVALFVAAKHRAADQYPYRTATSNRYR